MVSDLSIDLGDEVLDSLCKSAELDTEDPMFNREFVKMRVESAIEMFLWQQVCEKMQEPFVKRLQQVISLCEKLEAALSDLPSEDQVFALVDSETTRLDGGFLEELALVRDRLEMITYIRLHPLPPGRRMRLDSRNFVDSLVETFYLVDRGQQGGRGSTKYRRLLDFLSICIAEAQVPGAPNITDVKDSAWKKYVEPAITSARRGLAKQKKFYEDLYRMWH